MSDTPLAQNAEYVSTHWATIEDERDHWAEMATMWCDERNKWLGVAQALIGAIEEHECFHCGLNPRLYSKSRKALAEAVAEFDKAVHNDGDESA